MLPISLHRFAANDALVDGLNVGIVASAYLPAQPGLDY
jgi:hypothetical protein